MHQKKSLLLDTQIIQYAVKESSYSVEISKLLRKLSKSYAIGISEFTKFEIYRGLNPQRVQGTKKLVDSFKSTEVDKSVIKIAAALFSLYKATPPLRGHYSDIKDGDYILAASAFVFNSFLLSSDYDDFPRPFFNEKNKHSVEYLAKKGRGTQKIYVYELEPDIKVFNDCLQNHFSRS